MIVKNSQQTQTDNILASLQASVLAPPTSQTSVIEEKHEKNKQNSDPILSKVLTPYQAFRNGFEKAIASFIKLGQEKNITSQLEKTAPNKSEETELMEKLIKNLLYDFDSVKFIKRDGNYLAISHGKLYKFSALLERVDFNQIKLTTAELNAYHKLLVSGRLFEQPFLSRHGRKPTEKDFDDQEEDGGCKKLSLAEKEAINIYTGNSYSAMNNLMRGNVDRAIEKFHIPQMMTKNARINHSIKETLLHIAVAISGLNKLPDYIPPAGPNGEPAKYLYRGENYISKEDLEKRKWAVLKGGGITTEMGFLSTSYLKPAEGFFNEHVKSAVMVRSLKGKNITCLSQFGKGEREILLPPTQMQWQYHKDIITDIYKNTMALFIAKPVTVAPELSLDYVPRTEEWLVKKIDKQLKDKFGLNVALV